MKSHFVLVGVLCLAGLMACPAYAGTTINGTSITFNDATVQTTAFTGGGGGAPVDHGGTNNTVNGTDSFIGGGYSNLVTDDYGAIGGGKNNQAGDNAGTASDKNWATVSGGYNNTASGSYSTVGGGGGNTIFGNTASGNWATVGGGAYNTASAGDSTVGGGNSNTASGGYSTVSGGRLNIASGLFATVGGGSQNIASGFLSFVAGESANDGGFDRVYVWDDGSGSDATAANTFNVNATNGIYFNGGGVHPSSDRNMKEAFSFVSARDVLDKVVEMPVTTWRFKSEDDSIRHIGPVAQDFMAAFGYGVDDTYIMTTDADGVALAAIQGLYELHREKDAKLEQQTEINTALRWHNAQLEARLARLEKAILRESEGEPAGTD